MSINVGIIGYGYWGPNLVRNFMETPGSQVISVSDLQPELLRKVTTRYPTVKTTLDYRELISDPSVDAVLVATPVSVHYELAMAALKAGKHVLVEKPLTSNSEQALRLIDEAERRKRVLMVDHTFVYTGAIQKIYELINNGALGELYYYDSVRVNLGIFQQDVSVIWDLAVHDLSIMEYIISPKPVAVSATGISHVQGQPENIAYMTLYFNSNMIAHIHVNWLAPVKVRRTLIGGSQKMIVYDDLDPSEKVKVYDKGISLTNGMENIYKLLISYRTGDMWSPRLDTTEALRVEASEFLHCIDANKRPITDGTAGWRVVRLLEAASQSMSCRGCPVEL